MRKIKNYCTRWIAITIFLLGFVYSPFQMAMLVEDDVTKSWLKNVEDKKQKIWYTLCLAVIPREAALLQDSEQQKTLFEYYTLCQHTSSLIREKNVLNIELKKLTVKDIKDYLSEHIKEYLTGSDKDFLSECENRMGPRLYAAENSMTIEKYFKTLIVEYRNGMLNQSTLEGHIKDFMQTKTFKQNDLSQNNKMENTYFRRFFKEPNDEDMECKMNKAINDYFTKQVSWIRFSYTKELISNSPFIATNSVEFTMEYIDIKTTSASTCSPSTVVNIDEDKDKDEDTAEESFILSTEPTIPTDSITYISEIEFDIAHFLMNLIAYRTYALYILSNPPTKVIESANPWPCVII